MKNKILLTDECREILKGFQCFAFIDFEFVDASDLLIKLELKSAKPSVLVRVGKDFKTPISKKFEGWSSIYFNDDDLTEHYDKFGYVQVKPNWEEAKWQSLIFFKNTVSIMGSKPFIPIAESNNYGFMNYPDEYYLRDALNDTKFAVNERRLLTKKLLNLIGSSSLYYLKDWEDDTILKVFVDKEKNVKEKKALLESNFSILPFTMDNLGKIDFEEKKPFIFQDEFKDI